MQTATPSRFEVRALSRTLAAASVAVFIASCGGSSDDPRSGDLESAAAFTAPATINADSRLIVYRMTGISGGLVDASALVFVPHGTPPAGGWPIVGWVHGTTTVGQKTCAPSLDAANVDGGLTADAAPLAIAGSGYSGLIAQLVAAGYAVVAPDLEGLGAVAKTPYPYYSLSSEGRSLVAAIQAARRNDPSLSNRWAAVGHSDGGHGVLAIETYAAEAPELSYKGAVAFAPFASVSDQVKLLDTFAAGDPANLANYRGFQDLLVGMMTAGLTAQQPAFPLANVMGPDLVALMPTIKGECIFPAFVAVASAVGANPAGFTGFKAGWDSDPAMSAFLAANDPGVINGFVVRKPTLVLQGTADANVFEAQVAALVTKLQAAGSPALVYKTYAGANHQTVVPAGTADTIAFLNANLR
jgi:alpha-beta hydrolase superfamily lysophospholipase